VNLQNDVHRRFNALSGEWVLVSPHRTQRPWQGQTEHAAKAVLPSHDPECYLCPGNLRAGGERNPAYTSTFVFDNDFAALKPAFDAHAPPGSLDVDGLLVARQETGICRVVCFSPDHSLTLAGMSTPDIERVIECWSAQYRELGARDDIHHVQIFENRGAMMGASNPHPHGQIWANRTVPHEVAKESTAQQQHQATRGHCLLCAYAALEVQRGERLVYQNERFVVVVPFWAVWPFETLVLPLHHRGSLDQLDAADRAAFADALGNITRRYDALFEVSFPYSMGIHQRPTDGAAHEHWHLHAHFYPPLLRSATVRKFMVGYEMLAGPQRDITPETAAAQLKALPA
jgi:UDPglucose--hexose-1-phosphate uridylyltransferase